MVFALTFVLAQVQVAHVAEFKVYRCESASAKDIRDLGLKPEGSTGVSSLLTSKLEPALKNLLEAGKLKLVSSPKVKCLDGQEFRISVSGSPDGYELCGVFSAEQKQVQLGYASLPGDSRAQLSKPLTWHSNETPVVWSAKNDRLAYLVTAALN